MSQIQAIDVHGHYGRYVRGAHALSDRFASGDAETVVKRARAACTRLTIVSPLSGLLPRHEADAEAGNCEAAEVVARTGGLLQWVIVNPLQPQTYGQAAQMLQSPKCVGIKIHPEEHGYPISEQGEAIFEFAAEHDAVVLTHSGDPNSHPQAFVTWANRHANVRIILAHLGNGGCAVGDPCLQVSAIQQGRHGNLYVDTSSARSILPGLVEWAVSQIGSQWILYGTDTPLYLAAMQRARIDHAEISDQDKRRILATNAESLLDI